MAGGGTGGGRHWLEAEAPDFRDRMRRDTLAARLAQFYQPRYGPDSQEAQIIVAQFEEDAFRGTNSKDEYMKNISDKLITMWRKKEQLRSQLRQANEAQALQGGNSSVMPEAVMVASPGPTSQSMTPQTSGLVQNQHMVYPCTPNTQIDFEQKHHGMTTVGLGLQSCPQPMKSGASQSERQHTGMQLKATNFVGCSSSSVPKSVIRPNSQQNHLLDQNDSFIGARQPQMTSMNQSLRANQQEMGTQRYQMLGAQHADVSKMQPGQLRRRNNQPDARQANLLHSPFKACEPEPMTTPVQQITGAQQSTLLCPNSQIPVSDISAAMRSAREYDLTEELFCKIKSWKDAYFPQFLELERIVSVPTLTEEQLSSLPEAKVTEYKRKAYIKKAIGRMLRLMSLQKSDVHEGLKVDLPKCEKDIPSFLVHLEGFKSRHAKMNTGYQLQNCDEQPQVINLTGNASPVSGGKSRQQTQPANASILQSRQTSMARTPPPHQQSNDNHLRGTESPSFSSPGSLQYWSSSMLESWSPSPVADPASPLQGDIAAGHGEVQARGEDGTAATKKPIDRLMDAIRSSSPAALRSCANSIWSVLSIRDIVPHGKIGTILDCKSSLQQRGGSNTVNKMKRNFDPTVSQSESLPLGSMDGSCMSFECDALDSGSSGDVNVKRQKTQNANEALLEEIKSINNTLIDTVVSISDYRGVGGIFPCDGGTIIKLSYSAVSLSPTTKSVFATSETSLVLPVKLFIPADYPSSSPLLINDEGDEVPRKNSSVISASADVAFRHALYVLPEPRSIEAIASAWDACVRKAVTRFAHRQGGGTVSSTFGGWKGCTSS